MIVVATDFLSSLYMGMSGVPSTAFAKIFIRHSQCLVFDSWHKAWHSQIYLQISKTILIDMACTWPDGEAAQWYVHLQCAVD